MLVFLFRLNLFVRIDRTMKSTFTKHHMDAAIRGRLANGYYWKRQANEKKIRYSHVADIDFEFYIVCLHGTASAGTGANDHGWVRSKNISPGTTGKNIR